MVSRRALFESTGSGPIERLASLEARITGLSASSEALSQLSLGGAPEAAKCGQLEELSSRLAQLPLGSRAATEIFERMERLVGRLEGEALLQGEKLRPFAERLRPEQEDHICFGLLCYAGLWIKRVDAVEQNVDCAFAAAQRLFLVRTVRERWAVVQRELAEPALEYLASVGGDPSGSSKKAETFFGKLAQRLKLASSLPELLEEQYLDFRGYIRSLRGGLFEPDVLYGALQMSAALRNRLEELAESHEELDEKVLEQQARLDAIFGELEEDKTTVASLEPTMTVAEAEAEALASAPEEHEGQRFVAKRPRAGRIAALLGVAAALGLGLYWQGRSEASERPTVQLSRLSTLLERGEYSASSPRVFMGQVKPEAWRAMMRPERERAAEYLRVRLQAQGVQHAIISDGAREVVRIWSARVILVL